MQSDGVIISIGGYVLLSGGILWFILLGGNTYFDYNATFKVDNTFSHNQP
jgi:hypothetical protein